MIKIVIRTDASRELGSGHVMRCLTLADLLSSKDVSVQFITRDHQGNLNELIKNKGFDVSVLPNNEGERRQTEGYLNFLTTTQEDDAAGTIQILEKKKIDLLIVDHYALDQIWEKKLRSHTKKLMVIDDLSNRKHECDLLLDQNYSHHKNRYDQLISPSTIRLLGPDYALIRQEFINNEFVRQHIGENIKRVFIFFGCSDPYNLTTTTLKALTHPKLIHLSLDVVIGSANSFHAEIKNNVERHPSATLHIQVENIAELMMNADIAIGAGGTTTWERISVGLPSIVVTTAENQVAHIKNLHHDNYLVWIGNADQVNQQTIYKALINAINNPKNLYECNYKGNHFVVGQSLETLFDLLKNGPQRESFSVRIADISDYKLLLNWDNDPNEQKECISGDFKKRRGNQFSISEQQNEETNFLFMIESKIGTIGHLYFKRIGAHYNIKFSINNFFFESVLAKQIISKAIDYLKNENLFTLNSDLKNNTFAGNQVFYKLSSNDLDFSIAKSKEEDKFYLISVISDNTTWLNPWISNLLALLAMDGHRISWIHDAEEVPEGDFCFFLGCGRIVNKNVRSRNKNNLVVHESNLPKGKGWSPLSWQVLEGKSKILVTLFEAEDSIDSGEIYLQKQIKLEGSELINELRKKQADTTINLCMEFVEKYPDIIFRSKPQNGKSTFYKKRTTFDSKLNPNKTLAEQFNLLRIVDNERYPAYFDWQGHRYILKIEKTE